MTTFKIGTVNSLINNIKCVNIAHFFHENLFYALDEYLKNNNIMWILHTDLHEWEHKITLMCAKKLNISILYEDLGDYRNPTGNYNINNNKNFQYIMDLIQNIIQDTFPETKFLRNYKVLYFRDDADRRKMIGYEGDLDKYFDKIIYDLNSMKFEDQVKIFMKCSHFVTIEGAALTNVIFMNKLGKVFNISTTDNSWQLMFGTASCVQYFGRMILGSNDFNDNIQYTDQIREAIKHFIES